MKRKLEMIVPTLLLSAVLVVGAAAAAVAASSPAVTTGTPSRVTDTSAVLHGTINPNGSATAYYFEWGLTTAYGVASHEHSAGHGTSPVSVSATAADLIPGTVYHYRLVAANGSGSATGADHTFKTAGNPPPGVSTGPAAQPLGPDCKFSGQTVFNKHPGNTPGPVAITVVAHYLGNFYLTPHKTSGQTITLG